MTSVVAVCLTLVSPYMFKILQRLFCWAFSSSKSYGSNQELAEERTQADFIDVLADFSPHEVQQLLSFSNITTPKNFPKMVAALEPLSLQNNKEIQLTSDLASTSNEQQPRGVNAFSPTTNSPNAMFPSQLAQGFVQTLDGRSATLAPSGLDGWNIPYRYDSKAAAIPVAPAWSPYGPATSGLSNLLTFRNDAHSEQSAGATLGSIDSGWDAFIIDTSWAENVI